ncbi:MAG: hypothetical protein ACYCW6_30895 [Candidatus Xenobia bacterium]
MIAPTATSPSLAQLYVNRVNPGPVAPADQPYNAGSQRVLRTVLREEGPLSGLFRGPVRVALGVQEVHDSKDRLVQMDGAGQATAGLLSTWRGAISMTSYLGTAAQDLGTAQTGSALHAVSSALGGPLLGGLFAGAASGLKGTLDVVRGCREHDKARTVAGALKLGVAGAILAGAVAGLPALVAAGTAGYLAIRLVRDYKQMSKAEIAAYLGVTAATAAACPVGILAGSAVYAATALWRNRQVILPALHHAAHVLADALSPPLLQPA